MVPAAPLDQLAEPPLTISSVADSLDNAEVEVSTGKLPVKSRSLRGLIDTARDNIRYLSAKWEHQLLQNMDELKESLKDKLSEQDYLALAAKMETFLKHPLRKQMGRIRCISRSLDETNRYLD